jgi:phage shock protein PspC (stress-responsive transcriptional regulator)
MNTNTVNPEAPTTEPTDTRTEPTGSRPESLFGYDPERPALRRPYSDRVLTGVAAGLARYFGVDVTIVRIAFVVLTIIGGAGIPLYLAGLLLIPEEGSDQSIAGAIIESLQNRSR